MECFESVVIAGCQGRRFQPVGDQRYEDCVVDSELPPKCEVCVAPELVKRVEVFSCLCQACGDTFVCRTVAAESHS